MSVSSVSVISRLSFYQQPLASLRTEPTVTGTIPVEFGTVFLFVDESVSPLRALSAASRCVGQLSAA